MKATLKRTLTESTINAYSVTIQENGKPAVSEIEPVTVYGKISEAQALKEMKKIYPDRKSLAISKITENEVQYEISVDEFVKHAKRIEKEND